MSNFLSFNLRAPDTLPWQSKVTTALTSSPQQRPIPTPPSVVPVISDREAEEGLQSELFNAAAALKIQASQVSMHLSDQWRRSLFAKIDMLYDADQWDETDKPIEAASFLTFLRMVLDSGPKGNPGIGISNRGQLIAAWQNGKDSVTLEFMPRDEIRWSAVVYIDGLREYGAGVTSVGRLQTILSSYIDPMWFRDAQRRNEKSR